MNNILKQSVKLKSFSILQNMVFNLSKNKIDIESIEIAKELFYVA